MDYIFSGCSLGIVSEAGDLIGTEGEIDYFFENFLYFDIYTPNRYDATLSITFNSQKHDNIDDHIAEMNMGEYYANIDDYLSSNSKQNVVCYDLLTTYRIFLSNTNDHLSSKNAIIKILENHVNKWYNKDDVLKLFLFLYINIKIMNIPYYKSFLSYEGKGTKDEIKKDISIKLKNYLDDIPYIIDNIKNYIDKESYYI